MREPAPTVVTIDVCEGRHRRIARLERTRVLLARAVDVPVIGYEANAASPLAVR
jgi:hypothetical protein